MPTPDEIQALLDEVKATQERYKAQLAKTPAIIKAKTRLTNDAGDGMTRILLDRAKSELESHTIKVTPSTRLSSGRINPDRITYDAMLDLFEEQVLYAQAHNYELEDSVCIIDGCDLPWDRTNGSFGQDPHNMCHYHHDLLNKSIARKAGRSASKRQHKRYFSKLDNLVEDEKGYQGSRDDEYTRPRGPGKIDQAMLNLDDEYEEYKDLDTLGKRIEDLVDDINSRRL